MEQKRKRKILVGWQEWVSLPSLGIPAIKAKIDTGAKTSSLHAFDISSFLCEGEEYIKFFVHPLQGNNSSKIACCAKVIGIRGVMSSNAHVEERYVIKSWMCLGDKKWEIELTLSNRDPLRYRMLLGREALRPHVLINPAKSLCVTRYSNNDLIKLYA